MKRTWNVFRYFLSFKFFFGTNFFVVAVVNEIDFVFLFYFRLAVCRVFIWIFCCYLDLKGLPLALFDGCNNITCLLLLVLWCIVIFARFSFHIVWLVKLLKQKTNKKRNTQRDREWESVLHWARKLKWITESAYAQNKDYPLFFVLCWLGFSLMVVVVFAVKWEICCFC